MIYTPQQIKDISSLPIEIENAINEILLQSFNGVSAVFTITELNAILKAKGDDISNYKFNMRLALSNSGWDVEVDKPGYNESYPTTYTLTPKS